MNIICLDIDDCILPNYNIISDFTDFDIPISQLEINLKKLVKFCELESSKIFLTSSWSQMFIFWPEQSMISLKEECQIEFNREISQFSNRAYKLISSYLNGLFIGISSGNRLSDIKLLSSDSSNKLIVFDDWDLSELESSNVKFFRTLGSLDNYMLFHAQKFLRKI